MRLSEIYGMPVRTRDGDSLGRVREIHCEQGKVARLGIGAGSLIERLTGSRKGRHVAWDDVLEIRRGEIVVRD
jgi:sporulation protein YlmC with PRC-barrel domain